MSEYDDDLAEYFTTSSTYLESLVRCRHILKDSPELLAKISAVVSLEIDLAMHGAEKAMSEIVREKSKVTPLKSV